MESVTMAEMAWLTGAKLKIAQFHGFESVNLTEVLKPPKPTMPNGEEATRKFVEGTLVSSYGETNSTRT